MKKTLKSALLLLMGAAALQACQPEGYSIKGTLTGDVEGKTVFLCRGEYAFGHTPIDSTVVKNGQFEFKGQLEKPEILAIKYFPDSTRSSMGATRAIFRPVIPLVVENTNITIEACVDSLPMDFTCYYGTYDYSKVKIQGAPLQEKYAAYKQAFTNLKEKQSEASSKFYRGLYDKENPRGSIEDCIEMAKADNAFSKAIGTEMAAIIKANKDNLVGVYALQEQMGRLDYASIQEVLAAFPAVVKQANADVFAKADTVKNCAIGAPFVDVALQTADEKPFKLSDYVGKGNYTLVEFWASWCGPCRGEIPHLKHAYELYHADGFEIVSISMDEKKEHWTKALDEEKMIWPQGSDLKAFKGDLHKLYNFNGIPHCVLVGPDGKIVSNSARGPILDYLLTEIYGNKFEKDYRVYKR